MPTVPAIDSEPLRLTCALSSTLLPGLAAALDRFSAANDIAFTSVTAICGNPRLSMRAAQLPIAICPIDAVQGSEAAAGGGAATTGAGCSAAAAVDLPAAPAPGCCASTRPCCKRK